MIEVLIALHASGVAILGSFRARRFVAAIVFTADEGRGLPFCLGRRGRDVSYQNGSSVDDSPNNPFGGEQNSGIGRFGGEWVIEEFTTDDDTTYAAPLSVLSLKKLEFSSCHPKD